MYSTLKIYDVCVIFFSLSKNFLLLTARLYRKRALLMLQDDFAKIGLYELYLRQKNDDFAKDIKIVSIF